MEVFEGESDRGDKLLSNGPIARLHRVQKVYRRGSEEIHALRDIDFELNEGDFVSVIGPSGSGKTTLLNMIGCLDKPSAGVVLIDGMEVSTMQEKELARIRREKIGFVFQQFYLIPGLSVKENICLPLLFSRKRADNQHLKSILEAVGLSSRSSHKPNQLSGGEMQRVAIARALVNNPRLILADEPTGNLDIKNRERIFNLLKALNRQGLTIILVTHDPKAAEESGASFAMTDGVLTRIQSVAEYFCGMRV